MAKSYADIVSKCKLMEDGLRVLEALPLGITNEKVNALKKLREDLQNINSEQEQLKAALKTKTSQFENLFEEVKKNYSELKKRIKFEVPPEQWRAYGIEDKR